VRRIVILVDQANVATLAYDLYKSGMPASSLLSGHVRLLSSRLLCTWSPSTFAKNSRGGSHPAFLPESVFSAELDAEIQVLVQSASCQNRPSIHAQYCMTHRGDVGIVGDLKEWRTRSFM